MQLAEEQCCREAEPYRGGDNACGDEAAEVTSRVWGEVVTRVVYLLYRAPTMSLDDLTPNIRVCVLRQDVHPQLCKLDECSTTMIFMGYNERIKGYCTYDPENKRAHVMRDTIFESEASC